MALELAILTPLVIVMLLAVVAMGRVTQGRQLVDTAAASAARAASLANAPAQADTAAHTDAADTLTRAGLSCLHNPTDVQVDTSDFRPGGQVAVTLTCTVSLARLALAGLPGSITLTATSTSPLEAYRDLGTSP